jgi:hypothetical protein
MERFGPELTILQTPLQRRLAGSSAWINMLTGVDFPMPTEWPADSEK